MDDRDRDRPGYGGGYDSAHFPEPSFGIGGGRRSGFGNWGVGWGLQNSGGGPQGYGWAGGWQGGYGPRFGGRFGGGLAGSTEIRRPARHAGRGPKGYSRSDQRIEEEINERLTAHPDIDSSDVIVRVENGEVTLEGEVEDRHSRRLAEDIAHETPAPGTSRTGCASRRVRAARIRSVRSRADPQAFSTAERRAPKLAQRGARPEM